MGKVINPENAGKERAQMLRAIGLALRELARQQSADEITRDLSAFIVIALAKVYQSVEVSVTAWEKRGYWVKADRFRMEWMWSERLSSALRSALLAGDWALVAHTIAQVAQKLYDVKIPVRHNIGTPWIGAWDQMLSNRY